MMSSIRRSLGVVAGAAALMLFSGTYYSQAQEPIRSKASAARTAKKVVAPTVDEEDETPAPKATAKKNSDPHRRLYPYFGQLGLSDTQKNSIYGIRAKHATKITGLEKQLEDTRHQAMAEAEKVLTPAQKKLLEERRGAAHATAEAKSAGEMKPAPPVVDPTTTPAKKRRGRDDR